MAEARKRTSTRPATKGTAKPKGRPKTKGKRPPSKAAVEAADKLAEKAEAQGATGTKLTVAQRQLRDSAIMARRAAGWTQQMVADEYGVTVRQVRRIEDERGKLPSGLDDRPMDILEDLLRAYRQDIADAAAMAHKYEDLHPSAAVGAKRLARETHTQYVQLLGALGKLPSNLELFRSEAQMQRIAEEMVEKLEEFVRGEVEAAEVMVFFRRLLPEQPIRELTA